MNLKALNLFAILFLSFFLNGLGLSNTIQYLSPVPGSHYNSEQTNIIIGYNSELSTRTINSITLKVTGSLSGLHSGKLVPVSKNTKIIFENDEPFELGEKVSVTGYQDDESFSFFIRNIKVDLPDYFKSEMEIPINSDRTLKNNVSPYKDNVDSLPAFTIINNGPTANGNIFILNFAANSSVTSYCMILNNNGSPVFSLALGGTGFDFKKQNEHLLTYYDEMHQKYLGLDNDYNLVDSFYCGNGYTTDFHELRVMDDGSAWLMSYDPEYVDMSVIVPGGFNHALVTGLIIQHINANKNVIFQWRSWDHFLITDATHENLLATTIDYVHGNAIEIDNDNNIMISSRHMDEITKINSNTGAIIWRLGGKHNNFVFYNDTVGFSHQHCIRRIENNHIILFDNGNYHTPVFSRAIEYDIDENNKTVSLVWQYRHQPDIFAFAMGSVQRLPNGNTLIGWGSASPTLTEVTSNGNIAYQLSLPAGEMSYRSFRFEWNEVITGNHNNSNSSPGKYSLYQNYPNPFNPTTKIKFDIQKNSFVDIKIFDILGREITTLVNKNFDAGSYSIDWNAAQFPSGVYFYRIKAGDFVNV